MENNKHEDYIKDKLSKSLVIASNIIPPVGLYIFFKNKVRSPNKAKKALISAIMGTVIALLMNYFIVPFFSNLIF